MRPHVALAGMAAVAVAAAACSSSATTPARGDAGAEATSPALTQLWRQALSELGGGSASIYSFAFDAAPPEGSHFTLALHLTDEPRACARYAANSSTMTDTDLWYLQIDMNGASAGNYVVTTDRLSSHAADPVANVALLHRKNGEIAERYRSLSGTIAIHQAPNLGAFRAGSRLVASVDLSFSLHPVQALECRGGRGPAAPAEPTVCSCVDEDAKRSDCTLQPGQEQCCFDLQSERLPFHVDVEATPCASMCRAVAGLPDYCAELAQP